MRVLQEAASLCAEFGHAVAEADPAIDRETVVPTFRTISAINTLVALQSHPSGREPEAGEVESAVYNTAKLAKGIDGADYMRAIHSAHRLGRQMADFHEDYDVLLTPGLGTQPPKLGWLDMMMEDLEEYWRRVFSFSPFTVWFNLTGQPAMMIPLGRMDSGFPVAVQAIARHGDEATLFRLAAQLEAARPWFDHRPALVTA